MAKASKATKHFVKKHLGAEIQRRRKYKQLQHQYGKTPSSAKSAPSAAGAGETEAADGVDKLADMDVDEFMDGGFGRVELPAGGDEDHQDDDAATDAEAIEGGFEKISAGGVSVPTTTNKKAKAKGAKVAKVLEDDSIEVRDLEPLADDGNAVAEGKPVSAAAQHQADLEALKDRDPEFYAFLQENDAELLDFSAPEVEAADELDEAGGEGDHGEGEGEDLKEPGTPQHLTATLVARWCAAARGGSAGAARNLLRAYRAACHYGEGDEGEELTIGSSHVFNQLMLFVLRDMDSILRARLGIKPGAAVRLDRVAGRWKKWEPLVRSYLGNTLHVLAQMTDPAMMRFTLRRLTSSVGLLAPLAPLQRKLLAQALELFGHPTDAAVRLHAALFVREVAIVLPPPALDACLKGVYRVFASHAKFPTGLGRPVVDFMAATCVELYGLSPEAAYPRAFVYIRQAALHLRDALAATSKDALSKVYCWQFITCLELWATVLSTHGAGSTAVLRPLIYPLVQVLLATARLVPTARFFPLRLRCVRALNRLAATAGVYVPLSPLLLEVLAFAALKRPPTGSGGSSLDLETSLRVPVATLRAAGYQAAVVEAALELLGAHLAQWAASPAFPELSHLPTVALRRFVKECPVERFRRAAKDLVEALERNAAWVGRLRDAVDFSPKDTAAVEAFIARATASKLSPLAKFSADVTERAAAQREALHADKVAISDVEAREPVGVVSDGQGVFKGEWLPTGTKRKIVEQSGDPEEADERVGKSWKRAGGDDGDDASDDADGNEGDAWEGGEDDQVNPLVLSDEEDDEGDDDDDADDNPPIRKNAARGRGRGRGGRGRGRQSR